MSDALKRCAMRLGLGLHLWAQKDYALHDILTKRLQFNSDVNVVSDDLETPNEPSPEPEVSDAEKLEAIKDQLVEEDKPKPKCSHLRKKNSK